jgi:hypothetical protein
MQVAKGAGELFFGLVAEKMIDISEDYQLLGPMVQYWPQYTCGVSNNLLLQSVAQD